MNADWSTLEAHVVNGAFPLQRCIGSTRHSGVFLTQSTMHAPSAVALKLIPFDPGTGPAQLARWRAAVGLSHPHLVRLFEAGECNLDGSAYLYARMELADQSLAQVLERRALTDDEVREMLAPTLDVLDYLHGQKLVHGGLKPSNFLVVGDRLKLASDTVREFGGPETDATVASDIRALGATLCEALTRHWPEAGLPPELPESFRGIVARCLAADARARPTLAELQAWLRGESPPIVAAVSPAASPTRLVVRVELPSQQASEAAPAPRAQWRVLPLAALGVVVILLGWAGYRMFGGAKRMPVSPPTVAATPVAPLPTPVPVEPPPAPVAEPPVPRVNEVLPTISQSSLDSIRGTVRVSVRLSVASDGTVLSATTDDPGPSRYFERRALEAAKQWTFPPAAATGEKRSMRVRFAFTRSGVTASSEPLR